MRARLCCMHTGHWLHLRHCLLLCQCTACKGSGVNAFQLQASAAAQRLLHIMLKVACAHACRHAVKLSAARGKLWDNRPPVNLGPLTVIKPCSWATYTP
jgi:hypothetical protein